MFKYYLYKIGLFLLKCLPEKVMYALAAFLSDIQYTFSFRDRRAVRNNLKCILSDEKKARALTRQVFRNFGCYLVEFFQMKRMMTEDFLKTRVQMHNLDKVEEVLEKKKGGIILTAHIGNWEIGAGILGFCGYSLMAVALPHKERPVNDLFNHQRESKGVTVVSTNVAVRRCIEQLKNNKLVALVGDRDFHANGLVMDFLGGKMIVPKGAAIFSLKTEAPIIPTFLTRNEDGSFSLRIYDPIYPPKCNEDVFSEDVVLGVMKRYVRVIEEEIRKNPAQWLMFREFNV